MSKIWRSLEAGYGDGAVPGVWKEQIGNEFESFQKFFLNVAAERATGVFCESCYCWHDVVEDDGGLVAVCTCDPWNCYDMKLKPEDIVVYELDQTRFLREVAKTLGCEPRQSDLALRDTKQIGSFSSAALPLVLTIQSHRDRFRGVVAELAARMRNGFVLLAPTSRHLDAPCREILGNNHATFIDLESNLALTPEGSLQLRKPLAEIFASITAKASLPIIVNEKGNYISSPPCEENGRRLDEVRPRYALRKGLGTWTLIFDGQETVLKHEKGIFYVAHLLQNPPKEPIHAIDLAAQIPAIYRKQLGITATVDMATGKSVGLESHSRIQERSDSLDNMEAVRRLLRKQNELESMLDDETATEPEKAEALRELEQIFEFQKKHAQRSQSNADKVVRAVRRALMRFYERLGESTDHASNPHPVLRPFAAHLEKHLLMPSARFSNLKARTHARNPGFTYEPPKGVAWNE
jgi:hypothetical protein